MTYSIHNIYQCFALTEKSKNDEGGVPGILRATGEDRQEESRGVASCSLQEECAGACVHHSCVLLPAISTQLAN
jgi:hypothetical protein